MDLHGESDWNDSALEGWQLSAGAPTRSLWSMLGYSYSLSLACIGLNVPFGLMLRQGLPYGFKNGGPDPLGY